MANDVSSQQYSQGPMYHRLFNDVSAIDAAAPFLTQQNGIETTANGWLEREPMMPEAVEPDENGNNTAAMGTTNYSTVIHPQNKDTGISSASSNRTSNSLRRIEVSNETSFRPLTQVQDLTPSAPLVTSATVTQTQTSIQSQSQYTCTPCQRTFKLKAHLAKHEKGRKCKAKK